MLSSGSWSAPATFYNTAVLVGPEGVVSQRHKGHLPFLGVDTFVTPGDDDYRAVETPVGRTGIQI